MTEHLFKLKKDGKTVGYLKIEDGSIWMMGARQPNVWDLYEDCEFRDFDQAHPFVTKDKNDKDVFADDFVWFHWMGKKTKAQLTKDDLFNHLKSCEGDKQGLPRTFCTSDRQRIELIEDKEND